MIDNFVCRKLQRCCINTYLKTHLGIMWLFYCFVMFPSHQLVGTPPPPPLSTMCGKRRICNDACTLVIVLVHLKAVFIFLAAERVNLFFLPYFFFFVLDQKATSWGSFQASCQRSQRLSVNSVPFNPHRPMQLFPLNIVEHWVEHTSAHVQESIRERLLEEQFHFCNVSCWFYGV